MIKIGRLMKKTKLLIFVVTLFVFNICFCQVSFRAKGPSVVGVNEGFSVNFTISNVKNPSNFIAPTFRGVNIMAGPSTSSSSSTTIINGRISHSSSYTYTYTLQSLSVGTIHIPPAKIRANGKVYQSNGLTIKVEKNPTQSQRRSQGGFTTYQPQAQRQPQQKASQINIDNKALFVRAIPSKTNVVKGEEVVISYKLYTLIPVSEYQIEKIPSSIGFWIEELDKQDDPHLSIESFNGQRYQVATLRKVIVYPQKSGILTIKPMSLTIVAHIQTHSQRKFSTGDPFFDQFLNDPFFAASTTSYQSVKRKLQTNAITFNVKELPNEPKDYCGGVGKFSITSNISTKKVKAFDAFTLTYTISGKGNITLINNLPLNLPDEFEVSDPEITDNISKTSSGLQGSRTFRYLIIPRVEGDFNIPPLNISYFDISNNKYVTLSTEGYKIHIDKGNVDKDYATQLDERAKYKNMDIQNPIFFGIYDKERHIFDNYLIYIIPLFLLIALFVAIFFMKKHLKESSDIVNMKRKKATRVAIKRLKKARKLLDKNLTTEFEDEIAIALWNYLLDRFKINKSDFSIESCQNKLLELNIDEDVVNNLVSILNRCQYIRFSQDKTVNADQTIYDDTVDVISSIEQQLKTKKMKNLPCILFIMCLFVGLSANSQTLEQANHQYSIKNYDSALVCYKKLAQKEPSKSVYSSIGATYFRLSDYANSILYYEKALKLSPNDKTTQLNIKVTRARLIGDCYIIPDWFAIRYSKIIAGSLSIVMWAIIMIILFVSSCVLFFLYYFSQNKKQLFFYLCLSAFLLSLICCGFGIYRQNIQNDDSYAIIMKSNTKMKQSENNTSKNVSVLYKGQKIRIIKDDENSWLRVRTEDRKEGFIQNKDYKRI
jgi:tetratricopeptide (TPR) repeat protein